LVFLLQDLQVLLNFFPLRQIQFALHARQGIDLGVLGNFPFELLRLDALPKHVDLIFVKVFNAVHHLLLLGLFQVLVRSECLLLLQQFVLFQVRCQSVHFLA
jgi:hypothetical protein